MGSALHLLGLANCPYQIVAVNLGRPALTGKTQNPTRTQTHRHTESKPKPMATSSEVEAGELDFSVSRADVSTDEVLAAAESVKALHRLERKWAFWFDNQSKQKQGAAWGNSLRKVYTFDTIEEFWCLHDQIFKPSKLTGNADFHLFKAGIEPKWEDPECANGGKWTVTSSRKATLDNMWLESLMALIGEQFDESEEICGVVASVRQRQDKLSLWTRSASNEALQMSIGRKWKEILDFSDKMNYTAHDDSRKERSAKGRYSL